MSKSSKKAKETQDLRVNVRLHRFGTPFLGAFPDFSRPEPIGFFSVNEEREFQDNANNIGYLRLPPSRELPLDLNMGLEHTQRKKETADFHDIYHFCQYIYNHQELLRTSTTTSRLQLDTDFVTFRGTLRLIMCTPYERQNDYRLMATRLNGTIYISKQNTEEHQRFLEQRTRKYIDMCSWGFKFEQYCTTAEPGIPPDTTRPVNESKEFACIFRCKLNGLRLLFGAEMDCIKSNHRVDLENPNQLRAAEFVELKTRVIDMNPKQQRNFDYYKSLNWWSQSFLVGIKTIFAGLRDNDGFIHEIKEFSVGDLHRNKPWSAAAASTYLSNFLHELKTIMEEINDSQVVVMLDFKAKDSKVQYTVLRGRDIQPVVPEWFRQLMRGKQQTN